MLEQLANLNNLDCLTLVTQQLRWPTLRKLKLPPVPVSLAEVMEHVDSCKSVGMVSCQGTSLPVVSYYQFRLPEGCRYCFTDRVVSVRC